MIRLIYFSKKGKLTKNTKLPKKGKVGTFCQNYRPTSFVPAMSKVTESIITRRLQEYTEDLGITLRKTVRFLPP